MYRQKIRVWLDVLIIDKLELVKKSILAPGPCIESHLLHVDKIKCGNSPSVLSKKFLEQLQCGNLEFLIIPNIYMTIYT
jgi:hypothetical protein